MNGKRALRLALQPAGGSFAKVAPATVPSFTSTIGVRMTSFVAAIVAAAAHSEGSGTYVLPGGGLTSS